jgi:molybdopterin-guanine dinucleotide biosynthesis protein A
MVLGVVLAGGRSSRFGSDKALAVLGGKRLLDHAVARLGGWCDDVVVAGRETAVAQGIPDWPQADMGPLGGIAAGLRHAEANGFDSALTCSVDSFDLPENLPELLAHPPCYLADQPVIGHWPASAARALEQILTTDGKHSLRQFIDTIDAIAVKTAAKPAHINTPADLAAAEKTYGF